ncbi:hypothetical protein QAD02_003902 [Eretmocerus hayati]|uniref:Uncharacterized protein n=1 Tax=Eretmocerus hayati TaxID=131215 RepID=A0ACC2NP51_9HYME|nr:hypothetical protein QAD02_003902 [Eretmocerus hayati]
MYTYLLHSHTRIGLLSRSDPTSELAASRIKYLPDHFLYEFSTVAKRPSGAQNRKRKAKQDEQFEQSKRFMSLDKYITPKSDSTTHETPTGCPSMTEQISSPNLAVSPGTKSLDMAPSPSPIKGAFSSVDSPDTIEHENTTHPTEIQDFSDIGEWPTSLDQNDINCIIEKGPVQASLDKYPQDELGRHFSETFYIRKISETEYLKRQWLVHTPSKDSVFCFCCKLLDKTSSNIKWNSTGHNDWKHLGEKLASHDTKTNSAFRGSSDKLFTPKNGKFLGLVQLLAKFDPVMEHYLALAMSGDITSHYCGKNIQNELISLMAEKVDVAYTDKGSLANYFSIIADCTPNISKGEQLSILARIVDISGPEVEIEEYFLGFINITDSTGIGLTEVIVDVVELHG